MNCIYLRLFWYFVDIIFMSTDNQFVNCLHCFYWSAVAHNWILKSELLWSWLKLRASLQFARFVISNGRLRKFNFGLIKWPPLEVNRLNMILYTYKKKEYKTLYARSSEHYWKCGKLFKLDGNVPKKDLWARS